MILAIDDPCRDGIKPSAVASYHAVCRTSLISASLSCIAARQEPWGKRRQPRTESTDTTMAFL